MPRISRQRPPALLVALGLCLACLSACSSVRGAALGLRRFGSSDQRAHSVAQATDRHRIHSGSGPEASLQEGLRMAREHQAAAAAAAAEAAAADAATASGAAAGSSSTVGSAAAMHALRRRASALHQPLEAINTPAVQRHADPGISVRVDRYEQSAPGEWFTVSWSGVQDPMYDDWVALVVPADADLSVTAPSKWKFAASDPAHVETGEGSLRFRLISYRTDVAFALLRRGFDSPVEVARSAPIKLLHPNMPLQVHLARTWRAMEVLISFNTRDNVTLTRPRVLWGTKSLATHGSAAGGVGRLPPGTPAPPYERVTEGVTTTQYTRDDMCGGAAAGVGWVDAGHHHTILVQHLVPGYKHHYRVGSEEIGWSEEFTFVAPMVPGASETVRILAVADMGQGEEDCSMEGSQMLPSINTTRRLADEIQASFADPTPYSLVLHEGDISYARGYSTQWDNFFAQLQPVAASAPYMVLPGNHERDWPNTGDAFGVDDSGGECGVVFGARFPMPYPGPDRMWYSFSHGPLFIVQYSTEHVFTRGSEQYNWMVETLRSVNRRSTPWVLVGGHRPPYVASTNANWPDGDQPVAASLRDTYEDLWLEHGVDLTLHGHHHSYQRTCPVYKGECQGEDEEGVARAPVHLVIGHAGAGLSYNIVDPPPVWLKSLSLWWGYARLEVSGESLAVEVVSDADGRVTDSFTLRKPAGWGERFMQRRAGRQEGQGARGDEAGGEAEQVR